MPLTHWGKPLAALEQFIVANTLMKVVKTYRLVAAKNGEEAEMAANSAIKTIEQWLQVTGFVSGADSYRGHSYLEMMIKALLSFREHLEYIQKKAMASIRGLTRMLIQDGNLVGIVLKKQQLRDAAAFFGSAIIWRLRNIELEWR